ncbi:cell envelope biogenesis protein OmpA [Spirochaetia bacterium]|nr:cell envelope biogenesis protein OmpA [Spirochaetia bacterium]
MVERSDWSRYDNGKYVGHVYREVRASIVPKQAAAEDAFLYRGNFFVLEETLRDMRQSARPVDTVVPVKFKIYRDGNLAIDDDQGFPALRGFPAFPMEVVRPGAKWTAPGSRAVDPLNTGRPVVIPLLVEYEYRGSELYRGIPVYRVSAKYASRYRNTDVEQGQSFTGLQGAHTVDILIQAANGLPLLIRDNLDETFSWPDGSTVRFRGFTLIFNENMAPLNRKTVIASLGGMDVLPVPEGIRLVVKDIRFIPDSDEFLPEERSRLDMIAQALGPIADRTFLVEGHTAAIDDPAGDIDLSIRRAKRMVEELTRRGISADRFMYKGWGGTKPIGDNSNEEGRSRNRRVEITILE